MNNEYGKKLISDWFNIVDWVDTLLESKFYDIKLFLPPEEIDKFPSNPVAGLLRLKRILCDYIGWMHHDCSILLPQLLIDENFDPESLPKQEYPSTLAVLSKLDHVEKAKDYAMVIKELLNDVHLGITLIIEEGRLLKDYSDFGIFQYGYTRKGLYVQQDLLPVIASMEKMIAKEELEGCSDECDFQ